MSHRNAGVAAIDDDTAVPVNHGVGAFVLEPAERRPFDRGRSRVIRVDLNYPTEPVGLVRLLLNVEPVVKVGPAGMTSRCQPVSFEVAGLVRFCRLTAEIAVEILLCNQNCAPGVSPPAQLFIVPNTSVPVGSAFVRNRSWPAAGPDISIGVDACILRL
jgi:hypothetical protein